MNESRTRNDTTGHDTAESDGDAVASEPAEHGEHAAPHDPTSAESPGQDDTSGHRAAEPRDPSTDAEKPGDANEKPNGSAEESDDTEEWDADNQQASATSAGPSELTFRITPISLLAVMSIAVCVTPIAWLGPWALLLYLVPLALLAWILRVRTMVTTDAIIATTFRRTRMTWDEIQSVKLNERRWLRAVLNSGEEVLLPAVRVRDLSRLAGLSGGRLPDPRESSC